jgi:hypothetical protein
VKDHFFTRLSSGSLSSSTSGFEVEFDIFFFSGRGIKFGAFIEGFLTCFSCWPARYYGRFGQEVLGVIEFDLVHPEWLDITVDSLLFVILNIFQALVQSKGYNVVVVKPRTT